MNIRHFFLMLKYINISGIFIPFKIYNKTKIAIRTKQITLDSRLVLGSSSDLPTVSVLPINLFFGKKSIIHFSKSISIGSGVNIIVKDKGKLFVGANTYFTSDSHIEVVNDLHIGSDCAISWGVSIIDDDHHYIEYHGKSISKREFVRVGNKVWIGCNVTILKGTVIGDNSIVGAGSVLTGKEYPANSLIAGNPAKVVKTNVTWS